MSETFQAYLQRERRRLDNELRLANSAGADEREVLRIQQLRRIVDDQFNRWAKELSDPVAA